MKKLELEECKILMFDILKEFKMFCETQGLCYSLFGGSLLGAVRHGGFIPWDDDIDVAMPRNDYERFLKLFEKSSLSKKFKLYDLNRFPDYPYPFLKLANPKTLIQGLGKDSPFDIGLHIDIFPLDGLPRLKCIAQLQFRFHFLLRHLAILSSLHIYVKKRSIFKVLFMLIYKISTFGVKARFWNRISNFVAKRNKISSSVWAGNCIWGVGVQEVLPSSIFVKRKKIFFEGEAFYAFENDDAYLRGIYGDYMTLPPSEKRVAGHVSSVYLIDNE